MAVSTVVLLGVLGLSVDIGRTFIAKNELQAFTDAAALRAVYHLDGTTTGINRAQASLTTPLNRWNFGTQTVVSPVLEFGTSVSGPWTASPGTGTNYGFARVQATVSNRLLFLPAVVQRTVQDVSARSVAGQVVTTSLPRGLAPFTAVAEHTTGPNFGLQVGAQYSIQWPHFNGSRSGCSVSNPSRCFNEAPCSGDSPAAQGKVVSAWSSSNSGYWGSNSASVLRQQVLNTMQQTPLSVGMNLDPYLSSGNKASIAKAMDDRVEQDTDKGSNTWAAYSASVHNGRRVIGVPVVNPIDSLTTTVVGFGSFLLMGNGVSDYYERARGNDPFCAVYLGPYVAGGMNPGVGNTPTGVTAIKLVE